MRKDQEPSIIAAAKERKAYLELQASSRARLLELKETSAKRKKLGGVDSPVVLGDTIYGEFDGTNFSVEIRGNTDFDRKIALEFGSGEFYRTFVFDGQDCEVGKLSWM